MGSLSATTYLRGLLWMGLLPTAAATYLRGLLWMGLAAVVLTLIRLVFFPDRSRWLERNDV